MKCFSFRGREINGGFELRRSGGVSERVQIIDWIDETDNDSRFSFRIICCCVFLHSLEDLKEFWRSEFFSRFFVVVENPHQRIRDPLNCVIIICEWNDEGKGLDNGKRVEEFVGRRTVLENVVDGRCDPIRIT